ncbi:MAG: alpha/beta hydrolase [Crocinitomicaceae bacterium]|nr:alpha/beta hydrolase [Crocinitomicaceae bacterium]
MTPFSSVAPLIHVKTIGSGKPVVLLHGFLEDHAIWNTIYPDLVNEGCQCILIDLPCHGWSRYEGEICTMEQMAQSVFHYLKSEKLQILFVFGHSMGGYVALELMRLMTIQLTLVHSNFWADAPTKREDRNRVIEIVKKNKNLFLSESIPNLFAPENREFRREEIQTLIENAARIPGNEIAAATAGLRDRKPAYDLMNSNPISMIHGAQDPIIPTGILETELAKLEDSTTVYQIENCGHMGFIEQPEVLINHLQTVLFQ